MLGVFKKNPSSKSAGPKNLKIVQTDAKNFLALIGKYEITFINEWI